MAYHPAHRASGAAYASLRAGKLAGGIRGGGIIGNKHPHAERFNAGTLKDEERFSNLKWMQKTVFAGK